MTEENKPIEVLEVEAEKYNSEQGSRSRFRFQRLRLSPFFGIGVIIYIITALWGLFICFDIVKNVFGGMFAFLSLIFFPFILTLAPWYALFADHNVLPIIVVYGGMILGTLCFIIGTRITNK
jgi:hypothetical protein